MASTGVNTTPLPASKFTLVRTFVYKFSLPDWVFQGVEKKHISKSANARAGNAQIVPQRRALELGAEQAAALQFRDHEADKVLIG